MTEHQPGAPTRPHPDQTACPGVVRGVDPVANRGGVTVRQMPADQLGTTAARLAGDQGRLADMFVSAESDDQEWMHLVWAMDSLHTYLVLDAPIADALPDLGSAAPAAFIEECEIYEQYGLRTPDESPLNRIAIPPGADADLPRLGKRPDTPPVDVRAPHSVQGHAFEFPVGPVRAVGFESLYYGLVTSGEEIVDVYLFTWHKHRGLEWRLRGMTPDRALFLVERAEGLSAVANGWAFAQAIEQASGRAPGAEALRVRSMALEMERMYNHAAALAALCQSTGLSVGQAGAEIALELLLRLNCAVFGHRYLFGVIDVDGVARRPDVAALRAGLTAARDELRRVADALSQSNSFLDRLEATGVISTEQAVRLGLVGPVARASGVDIDTRRDHPHPGADPVNPTVAVREGGDVLSRYQVFVDEAQDSARILQEYSHLPASAFEPGALPERADPSGPATGLGWAESPRGESLAWVALDPEGRITRARLRPGSARNWRAFDDACRSQNVFTDVPIIEASFWLTTAGMAR